jgi:hypothetical protein
LPSDAACTTSKDRGCLSRPRIHLVEAGTPRPARQARSRRCCLAWWHRARDCESYLAPVAAAPVAIGVGATDTPRARERLSSGSPGCPARKNAMMLTGSIPGSKLRATAPNPTTPDTAPRRETQRRAAEMHWLGPGGRRFKSCLPDLKLLPRGPICADRTRTGAWREAVDVAASNAPGPSAHERSIVCGVQQVGAGRRAVNARTFCTSSRWGY